MGLSMEEALRQAGFYGVETVSAVIYARSNPALAEFTATADGAFWLLAMAWPLRATNGQMAAWMVAHPEAAMDIHQGETRIRMRVAADPAALRHWAAICEQMVTKCTEWRRCTRQRDEGM